MSTSQLDLTQPLDSTAFQPPMANASIRNVARGSPTIVHPPGDHTELFYHVVTEGHETTDPFADESEVPEPVRENRSESTVAEVSIRDTAHSNMVSYESECADRARQREAAKRQFDRGLPKARGSSACQYSSYRVHSATMRRTS